MTASTAFPSFGGLFDLAKRDGVDVRPTLLRVLTDLYVQTPIHSADEERQFVELALRLIDKVDDATRASVRARLSIYPRAPLPVMQALTKRASDSRPDAETSPEAPRANTAGAQARAADAPEATEQNAARKREPGRPAGSGFTELFLRGNAFDRVQMLRNLNYSTLAPAPRLEQEKAEAIVAVLEEAAFAADRCGFANELADGLELTRELAERVAEDASGEALLCVGRVLRMPIEIFERILLLLNPVIGTSVERVFALSRMYEDVSERVALIMLAAWRGQSALAPREERLADAPAQPAPHQAATQTPRHRPVLYDDESRRARPGPAAQPARPAVPVAIPGFGQRNTGRN
jgi:hypothetical protein